MQSQVYGETTLKERVIKEHATCVIAFCPVSRFIEPHPSMHANSIFFLFYNLFITVSLKLIYILKYDNIEIVW